LEENDSGGEKGKAIVDEMQVTEINAEALRLKELFESQKKENRKMHLGLLPFSI
jgi:hypothetical protein